MKNYTVTMRLEHPAWDEKDGYTYEVTANSKAQANKRARRLAEDDGHAMSGKGRYWFKAIQTD